MRTRPVLAVLALAVSLTLAGCTGDDAPKQSTAGLEKRLAAAQKAIDDAPSLKVSLSTDELPAGVSGLRTATGVGTHAPAFQGKVTVVTGGASLGAEVVATDGKVWAKTGFSPVFLSINPRTLKAPDPADLVGTKGEGLATVLTETRSLEQGKRSRDGKDVLTSIRGRLGGSVVKKYLDTADAAGTFRASYRLDDDDVLRDATITGPFYEGSPDVTYTIRLTPSQQDVTIDPPKRTGGR
ncbi:MAG: LppX_LprAFG lipoprotein [Aeromicrobium erythreum]